MRFARRMPLLLSLGCACALAAEPPKVPADATPATARGVLRMPAQARVGDTPLADAKLEFSCTTGKGGALQVAAILPAPEAVAGFPLDAFEGPDGVGETKMLAKWSMLGPNAMDVTSPISGWRGVDGDGFLLASARRSNKETDLARLLRRWVADGGQQLWLTVESPQGGAKLEVRAMPEGYRTRLGVALSQCFAVAHHR
ncbi:hypothetical protein [Dokdonella sp.]|uniref:hypothetical protein n=1 Tax=Dokdonella sp. TaxID=2291710 RepID=UPI002F410975